MGAIDSAHFFITFIAKITRMEEITKDESVLSGIYDNYADTQREIYAIEVRKTRNKFFTMAGVFLVFGLITIAISGIPFSYLIGSVLILPVLFCGLALLATKEPLTAAIIGIVLVFGLWLYNAIVVDVTTLLQGWIAKAIAIYLLFAALQSAKEAHRIKKELKL
jgi:hypothetical protein